MLYRTGFPRLRRALIALALIAGHGAATAAAAVQTCALPHGLDTAAPIDQVDAEVDAPQTGTGIVTDTDVLPHDHGPDAPPVPGASVCAMTMLVAAAPAEAPLPPELPSEVAA